MLMQAERASGPLGFPVSSFCNIFWTSPTGQRMSGGMCAQFHVMEVYIDLVTMKLTCDSSFKTTVHASLYLPRNNYIYSDHVLLSRGIFPTSVKKTPNVIVAISVISIAPLLGICKSTSSYTSLYKVIMIILQTFCRRATFKATVILLPLLGLTWVFGILTIDRNTTVFAWLFTICNSIQVCVQCCNHASGCV